MDNQQVHLTAAEPVELLKRGLTRAVASCGEHPLAAFCPDLPPAGALAGARLRSSLRGCPRLVAAGAWGGCACGQRDQSEQAAARHREAGASKTSDHALPASGPAHPAFGELAARRLSMHERCRA